MDTQMHLKLLNLISDIENSDETRRKFLKNPVTHLSTALNLDIESKEADIGLANEILLVTLNNDIAVQRLADITSHHQSGEIDDEAVRMQTAEVLLTYSPPELKEKIKNLWGIDDLRTPHIDPKQAIANIIVAVDVAVIVTEAAIVHSEVIASGRNRNSIQEIQRIANVISRGH